MLIAYAILGKKSIEEDEEEEPTNGSSGGGQILFSTFGRTTSPTPSPTPSSKTNDAVDDDDEVGEVDACVVAAVGPVHLRVSSILSDLPWVRYSNISNEDKL